MSEIQPSLSSCGATSQWRQACSHAMDSACLISPGARDARKRSTLSGLSGSSEDPINSEALREGSRGAYRVKFDLPRLDLPTSPDLSWFPWTGRRNEWS
jgi:hypothetical protein